MSDQDNPSAIIPAPSRQLGFPRPASLALRVAGSAALVWAGRRALSIIKSLRKPSAVTPFIRPARDLLRSEDAELREITHSVHIERTRVSVTFRRNGKSGQSR